MRGNAGLVYSESTVNSKLASIGTERSMTAAIYVHICPHLFKLCIKVQYVPNRSMIPTKYYLCSENGRIVGPPLTAATNVLLAVPLDVYPRPLVICIIRLIPSWDQIITIPLTIRRYTDTTNFRGFT